jgi:hypothetical protein
MVNNKSRKLKVLETDIEKAATAHDEEFQKTIVACEVDLQKVVDTREIEIQKASTAREVEFQKTIFAREAGFQKALTTREIEIQKMANTHAEHVFEFQHLVSAHAARENQFKDEVAAHKNAIAVHATCVLDFNKVVAAHATREGNFKYAAAVHEVESQKVFAAREFEFHNAVAARELEFKDTVAVHATREVEFEEAIIVRDQREADLGTKYSAQEIELCRLREVEAAGARSLFIYTGRETLLQTQVEILSNKIKSAEENYTHKQREMQNAHLKQLDSIAKKFYDLHETYKADLQRCEQEFQTRSQDLETVLLQNKTSNLFKIEHDRRVKAEFLLESHRKNMWQFVSVSSTEGKDTPCID